MKHKGLNLICYAAVFIVAVEIIIAWRVFDMRAAGLVFSEACAAVAMVMAVYEQNELDEDEEDFAEPIEIKCRSCGATFTYYPLRNPPEGREDERPRSCALCGGELEVVLEDEDE